MNTASYIDIADVGTTREVLSTEPPRGVRNLILTAAAILLALVIASGFLHIQQAERLPGMIVADESARTLSAVAAGIVASVPVGDGQSVAAGETVLTLDATDAQSRLKVLQDQEATAKSDLDNYGLLRRAVEDNVKDNPFDKVTQAKFYYALEQYWQQLRAAADTRTQQNNTQASTRDQAQAALTSSQASLDATNARIADLRALADAIRTGATYTSTDSYNQNLYMVWAQNRPESGTDAYDANYLAQVQSQIAGAETQAESYKADIARLQAQVSAAGTGTTADGAAAVTAQFMLDIASSEQQLHQGLDQARLDEADASLAIEQATLTAPVSGIVEMARDWAPGDQVQAGTQIFTVVPSTKKTYAEVVVPSRLAPLMTAGQTIPCSLPVTVGTSAVTVRCTVERLSAAYQQDNNGQTYYTARLTVETTDPRKDLAQVALPGVSITTNLTIRQVSILRWLGEKIGFLETP